jgi:hypothetical protein
MAGEVEETHHPEGVVDKDLAYQARVQEKIRTGQDSSKPSQVTSFANTMQELGVRFVWLAPVGVKWACGCEVVFGAAGAGATIGVCEGHR